jgi:hypothetical protein
VKVAVGITPTHNPSDELYRASGLRENLTSRSYGEGLETGRATTQAPRQSLTRQLDLRAIKTALGMDIVRGKTPTMVRKELWMYVLAYNLIRSVMATAAGHAGLVPRMLSFTGALQAVNIFGTALLFAAVPAKAALLEALYSTVSAHRVGQRPDRVEPRAVKRRPKSHPLLTIPRNQARKNVRQGQQEA